MVFNKSWFKQHEKLLLLVANTWLGRRFFGISKAVPRGKRITAIMPGSVTWLVNGATVPNTPHPSPLSPGERGEKAYRTEFLSYDKFAKRLYFGLKPFWYLLHFIDWLFSFVPVPQLRLNFGFDTLTIYPAEGANAPVDGYVGRTSGGESFSNLRSNAGTLADVSETWGPIASLKGGTNSNEYTRIDRGIFLFDTSDLDEDATINSATVSLYGDYKENGLGLSDAEAALALVGSAPASDNNLITADYQTLGVVRYTTDIPYSSFVISDYNDFALNATGLAAISKTGITRFGTRLAIDLDNGTPSWVSSAITELWVLFIEAGTSGGPKLVVDWTLDAVTGYVAAGDEVAVSAFPEVVDNVTATDEVDALRLCIVDEGDATASDEVDASLITFASESSKKIGAAPVWILKCPFATGTVYLSDRVFEVTGWEGGIITKGWVKKWTAIDEDLAGELAAPLVSDMVLDFVIDPAAASSIHDILWDDANNVEKTDCELYLWFLGFKDSGINPRPVWAGNIIDFEKLDELTYSVQLIDQSVGLNKTIGTKLNTTAWPGADPDDIGKMLPIVYGSVKQVPALAVDAGIMTTLATTTTDVATSLSLSNTTGLAAGKAVQIEDEQILIGAVSGNLITGCTRGYYGTTALSHEKGMQVGEVKTEYWYLLADHPVKSIGDIYVDDVRQAGSDFVKYTDYNGQAFVKFTALPVLRKSVDIEVDDNGKVTDYAVSHNDGITQDAIKITNQNSAQEWDWLSGFTESEIRTIAKFTHPGYPYAEATYEVNFRVNIWATTGDVTISARLNTEVNGYGGGTVGPWVPIAFWRNDGLGFSYFNSILQTFPTLSSGDSHLEIKISGTDVYYWETISVTRAVKVNASVVGTGTSSKSNAIKDKIDGGKSYYVGLIGNSSADVVIGKLITADMDGQPDDATGTYTGTALALIERPDHVMKHLLAVHAGFTNFTTDAGSELATKGYTFAGVMKECKKLRHWTNYLAWQCRCYFRFAGGEAQLLWQPDTMTPVKTITANMIRRQEDHRTTLRGPKLSPLYEVINIIDLHYNRDWTKNGEEAYNALEPGSDATSIGKYGEKQKPELFFFDFITEQAMAADVLAFYLARLKTRKKDFSMELFLDNSDLIFGKGITLEPASNIVCEVLKINTYPGSGKDMRNDQVILSVREY